jgi:recombination protein RecT
MAKKTVIRRIAKYLPMSVQKAAAIDSAHDAGKFATTNEYGDVVVDQATAIEAKADAVDPETGEVTEAKQEESKPDQLAQFEDAA